MIEADAVGLAVIRALAQAVRETIGVERESGIGQGVGSRNSQVIHAGPCCAPGSNIAARCVRGKALLSELRAARGSALEDNERQPSYSGARPKLYAPGQPAADFCIDGLSVQGVRGLRNLFGIESPGLPSSMAIAERAVGLLAAV